MPCVHNNDIAVCFGIKIVTECFSDVMELFVT